MRIFRRKLCRRYSIFAVIQYRVGGLRCFMFFFYVLRRPRIGYHLPFEEHSTLVEQDRNAFTPYTVNNLLVPWLSSCIV